MNIDDDLLRDAIRATLQRRNVPLPEKLPVAFTPEFPEDSINQIQWQAFLRRAPAPLREAHSLGTTDEHGWTRILKLRNTRNTRNSFWGMTAALPDMHEKIPAGDDTMRSHGREPVDNTPTHDPSPRRRAAPLIFRAPSNFMSFHNTVSAPIPMGVETWQTISTAKLNNICQ
jgi:hypothetical protein